MNFDEWWNEDYNDSENPFEKDSFGYWAYAGWCAAMQIEKQEPVALKVYRGEICYMSQDDDQSFGMWCPVNYDTDHGFPNETKFYTKPPIREWVGLTNEEIDNLNLSNKITIKQLILIIEAKLKEKNA